LTVSGGGREQGGGQEKKTKKGKETDGILQEESGKTGKKNGSYKRRYLPERLS